ncbi:hypothetical protein JB92DRAFT_3053359 [Gautieria morchelliformis]|nr:hypothetical protein JB92DRAFT_3053359 [Gautieria morchelliformis]
MRVRPEISCRRRRLRLTVIYAREIYCLWAGCPGCCHPAKGQETIFQTPCA